MLGARLASSLGRGGGMYGSEDGSGEVMVGEWRGLVIIIEHMHLRGVCEGKWKMRLCVTDGMRGEKSA